MHTIYHLQGVSQKFINFWRSFEIPLINCKVKYKLAWTNHCVLSAAAGVDNDNANSNNISFTIKDTKLYALAVIFSAKNKQKLSKFLRKRFEVSIHWNQHKTQSKNKKTRKVVHELIPFFGSTRGTNHNMNFSNFMVSTF